MDELLALLQPDALAAQTQSALEKVTRRTQGHGLVLKKEEAQQLALRQRQVLQDTARVEFGDGILPKLVFAFCDSPYIPAANFASVIDELMVYFYHFKAEAAEKLGDDELLAFMKRHFDGDCHGSLEYLGGTLLEQLAAGARFGTDALAEADEDEQGDADALM